MDVEPFPTAATRPFAVTVATSPSELDHVTSASAMTLFEASWTVAASVAVSPSAENVSSLGETTTEAGI